MQEKRFILDCIAGKTSPDNLVDYKYIFEISKKNRISPLIYNRGIKNNKVVNEDIKKELKRQYYINSIRNMVFLKELKKINKKLKQNKIEYFVLKGLILAKKIYGDYNFREQTDIDILIKNKKNIEQISNILFSMGYFYSGKIQTYNYWKKFGPHIVFTKDTAGFKVNLEIHWLLLNKKNNPFNLREKYLLKNPSTETIGKTEFSTLCDEHTFIYLCLHMCYQHAFRTVLRDMSDIVNMTDSINLNWEAIIRDSKKWRCLTFVYFSLKKVIEIFNLKEYSPIINRISYNKKHLLLLETRFPESIFEINHKSYIKDFIYYLKLNENLTDKIGLTYQAAYYLVEKIRKNLLKQKL
ncbi:hypothetical protein GF327_00035 [Candidatus Woesearchaeota archaeon]|nr:hypothetical protein [Candidatus Woesearchaeota archaeon]